MLYFIYPGSCGVKLATNRCAPSARTEDVTRPPLTKISKLPEPAWDPSTKMIKYLLFTGDHCKEMHVLHTFKFNRSSDSTVWYVLNTNRPSTWHIFINWTETSRWTIAVITVSFRCWIFLSFFQCCVLFVRCRVLFRWKWCYWSGI